MKKINLKTQNSVVRMPRRCVWKQAKQRITIQWKQTDIIFCNRYRYFHFFFSDIWPCCRYSIGHQCRYSKICLPIFLPIF